MTNAENIVDIKHSQKVAAKLQELVLVSNKALTITQNLHWNVEGDGFFSIHKLTEEIYDEQFEAIDEVAERLRALGQKVESNFEGINGEATIEDTIAIQEKAAGLATELIELAEDNNDAATADLATERQAQHQKNTWMLQSQNK